MLFARENLYKCVGKLSPLDKDAEDVLVVSCSYAHDRDLLHLYKIIVCMSFIIGSISTYNNSKCITIGDEIVYLLAVQRVMGK